MFEKTSDSLETATDFERLQKENQSLLEENQLLLKANEMALQRYQEVLWENDLHRKEQKKAEMKITELTERCQKTEASLSKSKAALKKTKKKLEREVNSWNWRIGDVMTRVPKKIYYAFHKKK